MAASLKFISEVPLKDVYLRMIATKLWEGKRVLSLIKNFHCTDYPQDEMMVAWRKNVEGFVLNKLQSLKLSTDLEKQMAILVTPIGEDILKWKVFNEHYIFDSRHHMNKRILKQIQWTSAGYVDYQKTAERLTQLQHLSIEKRFEIACFYCLVDDIRDLWQKLPEKFKLSLFKARPDPIWDMYLEYYWAYILENKESDLFPGKISISHTSFSLTALQHCALIGNIPAFHYFYNKIMDEEKDVPLNGIIMGIVNFMEQLKPRTSCITEPYGRISDILRFMLFRADLITLRHLLENHPHGFLSCFLEWPCHDLFLDIANVLWVFYSKGSVEPVVSIIRNTGFYKYNPNLFQKFFVRTPCDFKKSFVSFECEFCEYFHEFFLAEDTETMEVVFKNLNPEERVQLVSSFKFFDALTHVLLKNKWYLAECCFREATPFKEDREKVKQAFTEFLVDDDTYTEEQRRNTFQRVSETLNEMDNAKVQTKRSSEDETLQTAEKISVKRKRCFH